MAALRRHFFLEFRELQCTDGRADADGHGRTEGEGDGANLITTSSEQITRERGGKAERESERVTVEVKRDKIDRRHDVAVANAFTLADGR